MPIVANIQEAVQNFAIDKAYLFDVMFPNGDNSYYNDPCPIQNWFPATSVQEPIGWFVQDTNLQFYLMDIPVPNTLKFQLISMQFVADVYKKLEFWFERWYKTIHNGGLHMGTLMEVSRPLRIVKYYNNAVADGNKRGSNGIAKDTTYYVVPSGEITSQLVYTSTAKSFNITFNIVGKINDKNVGTSSRIGG